MQPLQFVLDDLRAETDDVCAVVADASQPPPARGAGSPEWIRFGDLVDVRSGSMSDAVADFALARMGGHRDAAVAHAAAWLTELMLWPMVSALALHGRAWTFEPSTELHRRSGSEWDVSRHVAATIAVTVDDAIARTAMADSVLVMPTGLDVARWAGREWASTLLQAVDALRTTGPYGRRGLWATVADEVVFAALVAAHRGHRDDGPALELALAFLDEVEASTGETIPRPPIITVDAAIGPRRSPIKATCCLRYKVPDFAVRADPLCLTCPRRTGEEAVLLSTAWVDRLCAGA